MKTLFVFVNMLHREPWLLVGLGLTQFVSMMRVSVWIARKVIFGV